MFMRKVFYLFFQTTVLLESFENYDLNLNSRWLHAQDSYPKNYEF